MGQYVKYYSSFESGAPVLDNTAGSAVNLFDAILVNGFGSKTLTSLNVTSNVATAVVSGGHLFDTLTTSDKDITIAGATPSLLNGVKQVTIVNSTTFTFPAPGVADGAATGTITAIRSPLGWTKLYSGTNKAMYKSSDVTSSGMIIRMDDSTASSADFKVLACESATGIDTYSNQFPTTTQQAVGWLYWGKGANTTRVKNWSVIGDGKMFYFIVESSSYLDTVSYRTSFFFFMFGDFKSFRPADTHNCVLNGALSVMNGSSTGPAFLTNTVLNAFNTGASYNIFIARDYLLTTTSIIGNMSWMLGLSPGGSSKIYPSPVNQGLTFLDGVLIAEQNTGMVHPVRGLLPGLSQPLSAYNYHIGTDRYQYFKTTDGSNKTYLLFHGMAGGSSTYIVAFNVSENWRV